MQFVHFAILRKQMKIEKVKKKKKKTHRECSRKVLHSLLWRVGKNIVSIKQNDVSPL